MAFTKKQLIDFINERYGDDDYFDLTFELAAPQPDFSLMGCRFGSAEHMTRKAQRIKENDVLKIEASRYVGGF